MRDVPLDPAKLEGWAVVHGDLVVSNPERALVVREVLDSLPRRHLDIINAVYFERLPLRAVAQRVGMSHTSVRRHCLKFARMLEEALGASL